MLTTTHTKELVVVQKWAQRAQRGRLREVSVGLEHFAFDVEVSGLRYGDPICSRLLQFPRRDGSRGMKRSFAVRQKAKNSSCDTQESGE